MAITVPYISNQPPATETHKWSWAYVNKRFELLHLEASFSDVQKTKFTASMNGLVSTLDEAYWPNRPAGTVTNFLTGSWRKGTQARPESDIDLVYLLPWEVRDRFAQRTGNIQSAILQEVKNALLPSYPRSDIKGDGPTVVADLSTIKFEILPVFLAPESTKDVNDANLRVWVCHTSNGGRYTLDAPIAQLQMFNGVNTASNGNAVRLTRMMKVWKKYCNVSIKSVVLEGLVIRYLAQYQFADKSIFWHDWLVRDFFAYMLTQSGNIVLAGTGEQIPMTTDWVYKAKAAHSAAVLACIYEESNLNIYAGTEWQKIFGNYVPLDAS